MIDIQNTYVSGFDPAIRGMRNPMNSWDKSDTEIGGLIGENDLELMKKLAKNGSVHAKYRRMIMVYCDITAPLYWWKEFDTYKVGTVANSCSTMHKIMEKPFEIEDFSHEHLSFGAKNTLECVIEDLNFYRELYIRGGIDMDEDICGDTGTGMKLLDYKNFYPNDKRNWWQVIQLLPSSYNQKRTVMMNYEVVVGMYRDRRKHKLDEWVEFCKWIEELPYAAEMITVDLN